MKYCWNLVLKLHLLPHLLIEQKGFRKKKLRNSELKISYCWYPCLRFWSLDCCVRGGLFLKEQKSSVILIATEPEFF